ncbi:MAG: response regulator, partial [Candidatus Saccharimonas sp.]|nr:response regulator [Planctomycetaceae bacterium]
ILMNLSINARDAMPDGGTLTIEATSTLLNGNASQLHPEAHPGWYVLLKVSDTGTGMSSEVLDRIFDPFFTTKEIGKGTGLGLATVQGIVKSHGGFINVYSEPACGSKFSIYLPAAITAEVTTSTPSQAPDDSGRGRTVLLVDDEGFILQVTAAALEGAGYRVLTARDGSAAIAAFSQHRYEVSAVLLDMMMPGLDGLQTLDQLRQIDPQVVVIACSGLRTSQRETEVLKRGAKAFLPKPYSEDQLLLALTQVLERDS